MKKDDILFDKNFAEAEQLPRKFTVDFESVMDGSKRKARILVDGVQIGDEIDDNSREIDGYRFHDVFHYTFAAMLGWSPCTRAMMKRKRKSVQSVDEVEDGARAIITEESISLIIFSKAKQNGYFKNRKKVNKTLLDQIKEMTEAFEVTIRTSQDWENAILKGYSLFRNLVENNGGKIHFNMLEQTAIYESNQS